ncbi:MAG: trypsin-like peptidase domain-containing protein [Verrucomicrobia bacterium]|nr:trypsin-like peptidase domain-containing protein [Verrucomicrobiota bacterium]
MPFLVFLSLVAAPAPAFAAKTSSTSKASTRNVSKSSAEKAPKEKSVEELAASVRESVVVISHFGRDGKVDGVGAGFVVGADGLIATCLHVIGEGRPVTVQLADGRRFDVTEVFAWDRKLDLALVRIAAEGLPVLPLGDSDALKQGTPIIAIGNPQGLDRSVVQGVVSARRDIELTEMIQLAIPVEPGNSGGPMLDMQGRVHGILTLKSAVTENLGFAMPVNQLKPLLEKPNRVPMPRWLTIGALNPKDWTPIFGARWSQKAGHIKVEGYGNGSAGRSLCLSGQKLPARPYEVSVAVKLDDENGAAGLVFGSDGEHRHYGFYPSAGQMRLTRFEGPNVFLWTVLKQFHAPAYRAGDWNTIKVRFEEEKILGYVNDELVVELEEDALGDGQIGLAKFRDTKAEFKQFTVAKKIAPATPSAELVASVAKLVRDQPAGARPDAKLIEALQPKSGASQLALLEQARRLEDETGKFRRLAAEVHKAKVQDDLVKALAGPEEKIDLFHAALLIAKLDNPEVDVASYRRQLDQMAQEISAQLPQQPGDNQRRDTLNKFLYEENGFHGSRGDYYNRANSYLNEVMDDREGIPITLAVLYLELADRIGLKSLAGIPLPGHFVVQQTMGDGRTGLIDVFDGGKPLSRIEAAEIVQANTGGAFREEYLTPATKREIVVRMLRNLVSIALKAEATDNLLRYLDVLLAIAPDSGMDYWSRAVLRLRAGDRAGAKEDLRWLMEKEPPGIDIDRVVELYRSL